MIWLSHILLLLGCFYNGSVLAANGEQSSSKKTADVGPDIVILNEMLLLPKVAHLLVQAYFEKLPKEIQLRVKHYYSYCSALGVPDDDFRSILEIPVVRAVVHWGTGGESTELALNLQTQLIASVKECEKYVWKPNTSPKAITSNSLPPIGRLDELCRKSSSITLTEEAKTAAGKIHLEQVDRAIKANLPITACARIAIIENMLQFLQKNGISSQIVREHHRLLITNIFIYRNARKVPEFIAKFVASVENSFAQIKQLYNHAYKETLALKGLTEQAGKPILVANLTPLADVVDDIPIQAKENFERTWNVLSRIFDLPINTHPIILGNLDVIPDTTVEIIRKIYDICLKKKINGNRYDDTQFSVASVITNWKRDHNQKNMDFSIKTIIVGIQLIVVNQNVNYIEDYLTIKTLNKCLRENVNFIDKKLLENEPKLSKIVKDVVPFLPPECCVRMTILRYCLKKRYKYKNSAVKRIIDALKIYAEDGNRSQLNSFLIQITREIVSFFEERHLEEELKRKTDPTYRDSLWKDDSPSSADTTMAEPGPSSSRGKEPVSGEQEFLSPDSARSYSFKHMLDDAVNSPRSGANPDEATSASPAVQLPSHFFVLPDYTYSNLLVFTSLVEHNIRSSISRLLNCANFDTIDEDVKYIIQNKIANAVHSYKNGEAIATVHKEIITEWHRCTKYWSYQRAPQRAARRILDHSFTERRAELGGPSSIPVASSSTPMEL